MDRQSQQHYEELKRKQTLIKDRVRSVFCRKSCGMSQLHVLDPTSPIEDKKFTLARGAGGTGRFFLEYPPETQRPFVNELNTVFTIRLPRSTAAPESLTLEQINRRIDGRFTHLQQSMGQHNTELRMAHALAVKAAKLLDEENHKDAAPLINGLKAEGVEIALNAVDAAARAFGGEGYSDRVDIGDRLRDLNGLRIADGATDVMRSSVVSDRFGREFWEFAIQGRERKNDEVSQGQTDGTRNKVKTVLGKSSRSVRHQKATPQLSGGGVCVCRKRCASCHPPTLRGRTEGTFTIAWSDLHAFALLS
jgi:hypothetical protein